MNQTVYNRHITIDRKPNVVGLLDIFRCSLKIQLLKRDDNIFEMGAHSFLVLQLSVRINNELGTNISPAQIFKHPSVSELETYLEESCSNDVLIKLHNGNTNSHVVFVHSVSGYIDSFISVSEHLKEDTSIYAFQSEGYVSCDIKNRTIKDIAQSYVDRLHSENIVSNITIVGYSMGSFIAHEMACLLSGHAKLVIIDTNVDTLKEPWDITKYIEFIYSGAGHSYPETLYDQCNEVKNIETLYSDGVGKGFFSASIEHETIQREFRVRKTNHVAMNEHKMKVLDGDMVLIYAEDQRGETLNLGVKNEWYSFITGDIVEYKAPGNHVTMLSDKENASQLSKLIM